MHRLSRAADKCSDVLPADRDMVSRSGNGKEKYKTGGGLGRGFGGGGVRRKE